MCLLYVQLYVRLCACVSVCLSVYLFVFVVQETTFTFVDRGRYHFSVSVCLSVCLHVCLIICLYTFICHKNVTVVSERDIEIDLIGSMHIQSQVTFEFYVNKLCVNQISLITIKNVVVSSFQSK